MEEQKFNVSIGGAWVKESKAGNKYLSIKFNDGSYGAMFKNEKKQSENSPDWRIIADLEVAQKLNLVSDYDKAKITEGKLFPKKVDAVDQTPEVEDVNQDVINLDDIPF
jgi:uncharacterized protein (DUF736 family)